MTSLKAILHMLGEMTGLSTIPGISQVLDKIPLTVEGAMNLFPLDAHIRQFAVCPKCHHLHEGGQKGRHRSRRLPFLGYPSLCENVKLPGVEDWENCETPLLDSHGHPLKSFSYHSFPDYLAQILSRRDIEENIDKSCDEVCEAIEEGRPLPEEFTSVFDATFVRTLTEANGRSLFVRRERSEARLLFSLNVDWFNPEGNRLRGPSKSLGVVAMSCLNLPISKRYHMENMYLAAIIPGPKEPNADETARYLEPLFLDIRQAFLHGFRLSRTARHPAGRVVKATVAIGVMDLKAARKVMGLKPEVALIFCSRCELWKEAFKPGTAGRAEPGWKRLYHSTNHLDWPLRDVNYMRHHAAAYANTSTISARRTLYNETGVGHSAFWLIPGFNPVEQLVIDPMHCLLEGACSFHVRDAMGLEDEKAKKAKRRVAAFAWTWDQLDDTWFKSAKAAVRRAQKLLTWELDNPGDDDDDNASLHSGQASDEEFENEVANGTHPSSRDNAENDLFTVSTLREQLSRKKMPMAVLQHLASSLKLRSAPEVSVVTPAMNGAHASPETVTRPEVLDDQWMTLLPSSELYAAGEDINVSLAPDYANDWKQVALGPDRKPQKSDSIYAIAKWVSHPGTHCMTFSAG